MAAIDLSFCKQRASMQMNREPLTRFVPINPYASGQFTKMQLDMRRKVEILKYSANKSSSQTNNLTKKETFAKLVRGGGRRSTAVMESNKVTCPADDLVLSPTTSSDVPGPVIYLYEDKSVPLYNYSDFNARSYSDYVATNLNPWQFVVLSDILVVNNGTSNVYYLIINSAIDQPYYTYNITMPVGLSIAGIAPPNFSGNISAQINSISLSVYYNDGLVNRYDLSNSDLSGFSNMVTINSSGSPFSATQFIGNLGFNNIKLYTVSTYVYTFVLTANVVFVSTTTSITNKQVALVANMSSASSVVSGCTIISTNDNPYAGASISGN